MNMFDNFVQHDLDYNIHVNNNWNCYYAYDKPCNSYESLRAETILTNITESARDQGSFFTDSEVNRAAAIGADFVESDAVSNADVREDIGISPESRVHGDPNEDLMSNVATRSK